MLNSNAVGNGPKHRTWFSAAAWFSDPRLQRCRVYDKHPTMYLVLVSRKTLRRLGY